MNTALTKRNRIRVALFAYAYEIKNNPLVSDFAYDELAITVGDSLKQETGHAELDFWFHENFDCITAMWVHAHPEIDKLEKLYARVKMFFK